MNAAILEKGNSFSMIHILIDNVVMNMSAVISAAITFILSGQSHRDKISVNNECSTGRITFYCIVLYLLLI